MFLAFAAEEFLLAAINRRGRWLWALRRPVDRLRNRRADSSRQDLASLADIIGFVFLLIGVLWMVQAFMQRVFNEVWWHLRE
jgi:hypothetical protein